MLNRKRIVRPFEIKAIDDKGSFEGLGSVFGNTDSYNDVVCSGAFTNDLQSKTPLQIKCLWQHDSRQPIGTYSDIRETDEGLYVKGQLLVDDVQQARECHALLKAGAIDGLSIGYTVNDSNWGKDGKNYLTDLKLWEISVVTFPANDLARITDVKSMTITDFEHLLRDAGFSKSQAKRIASVGFAKAVRRDVESEDDTGVSELLKSLNSLNQSLRQRE